jgi:polyferredoxin
VPSNVGGAPVIDGYLFAAAAGGMALATAYLVRLAAHARTTVAASVVLFLLAMMAEMFAGAVLYYTVATPDVLIDIVWGTGLMMAVTAVPVFIVSLREAAGHADGGVPSPLRAGNRTYQFRAAVVLLVLLNEVLMGWAFQLGTGTLASTGAGGPGGDFAALGGVLVSPWFVFSMAAEMAVTLLLLRPNLSKDLQILLPVQAVLMALTPAALAAPAWVAASTYAGSAVMIALFVYAMEYIYRHRNLEPRLATYLVRLIAVYAVMMAGLVVWFLYGAPELLGAALVLEMVLYFGAVLGPSTPTSQDPFVWQLSSRWAFALLSGIFAAELGMGAVLDLQIEPSVYSGAFFALPLTGGAGVVAANALANGFWFLADVCGSTWFLAMMGIEMGTLVVFKFRETRQLETRIRLLLMMGCYGAFAVFFPSIYLSLLLPGAPASAQVPVLGWSMGIGSAPLAAGVFGVLLVTYAVTGSLSALFGRRVICSVFCTAPLMYQGTAIDAMGSFNRTGRIGRKYLGSRFSSAYSVTTGLTMGSLAVASAASYLDQIGRLNWLIDGTDPTVFLFAFYFSVLWYVMFVTIPYTGNYNCVTMGWCYTGTIAQAFQSVGFFKLKVRDREVCKACTTLDCAKACPVGLVDMPGHFRTKGEFRSSKCCGVGDCVGACPYGNMYIADVRHWLRRRRGVPEVPDLGDRLPMVAARAGPTTVAAPSTGSRVLTSSTQPRQT